MALTVITVSGTFKKPDGTAASGSVRFNLVEPILDPTGNVIVAPYEIVEVLDGAGSFSTDLYATEGTGLLPLNNAYEVEELIDGLHRRRYEIAIPSTPSTANLADYAPVNSRPLYEQVGPDGPSVELQTSATHVQWRVVGDVAWTDLVLLSAITGTDGADGLTVLSGAAAPTTEGINGDFYIRTSDWTIYGPKTAGAWGSATSLVGPAGVGAVDSVNAQTGVVVLDAADVGADAAGSAAAAQAAAIQRANHTGTQTSSTIADFTEAVQDAVAALLAQGTNITLSYNDAGNTLTVNAVGDGAGLDAEAVRDAIGIALIGSGLISVTVNDALDTITISTTATANDTDANLKSRANHTGTQLASTVSDFAEAVSDQVGTMVTGNTETGITVTYQDADNTLDFAVTDSPLLGGDSKATILAAADAAADAADAALYSAVQAEYLALDAIVEGDCNDYTDAEVAAVVAERPVVDVIWNATTNTWPARPTGAAMCRFWSTNEAGATAPTDINLANGDVWFEAP